MVPPKHMEMLYAKAAARNRKCNFVAFPDGMHMDTWVVSGDNYWKAIQQFLEQNAPVNEDSNGSQNNNGKYWANIFPTL